MTCVNLIAITTCQSRVLSFCRKKEILPLELRALFSYVELSWGHAKRVTKILKSEVWHQIRLYQDALHSLICDGINLQSDRRRYHEYRRLASQTAEFLWQRARSSISMATTQKPPSSSSITSLDEVVLSSEVANILQKSLKFCYQPSTLPQQLLAMVRKVANLKTIGTGQ
ncbi:hypothetical protein HPB50_023290 [Hyalomma asiaticum]|uniref:Uncharacterized protein n=1 Tax=Hyalomma asiaticum TaxID=266040 RepID=A0ACB7TKZ7_HYAAI|nr:hypothetical protein HPB50_023290 [Hyalomma asiaticum]